MTLATARALAELDVLASLAEAAVRNRYVRPELAEELASSATFALAMGKRLFAGAFRPSLEEFLELETHVQNEVLQTQDHQEGAASFMEKRKPQFKGC